jgi:hypothetical protein
MTRTAFAATNQPATASARERSTLANVLLWIQGPYYLVTGVWPLFHVRSFQYVTGQKYDHLPNGTDSDHWLVYAVGALVTAVAITLLLAAWRQTNVIEIPVLAIGAAVGLTAIDVIFVARQVIAPIYLVDAAIQIPLICAWIIALVQQSRSRKFGR